jgi:hypothetical protein
VPTNEIATARPRLLERIDCTCTNGVVAVTLTDPDHTTLNTLITAV